MSVHPIKPGTRVWHSGSRWSMFDGTAHVIEAVPQRDGTWEYLVQNDEKLFPDSGPWTYFTWWASYHCNTVMEVN